MFSFCHRQGALQSGVDVAVHGPIPQAHFLGGLGIEARLDALLERATVEEQASLVTGFNRLVGGQQDPVVKIQPKIRTWQEPETSENSRDAAVENERRKVGGSAVGRPDTEFVGNEEEEGMGFTYKVMALTAAGTAPPVPFSYKSPENKDSL